MNKLYISLLLSTLSTNVYTIAKNGNASNDEVKAALQNLGNDFESLGTAIKTNSEKQANAIINEMKDWVKKQENSLKELQAKLQASIDQTKSKIQSKIDEIAAASETKDEAKATALLKQIHDETNQSLQNIKETTAAAKDKFESDLKNEKTKWDKALENLQAKHQKNLKAFNNSVNEVHSYVKGFKSLIKRKMAKPLASSTTEKEL